MADVVSGAVAYDPPAWFGRRAPLVLEIGSGTGESTAAQAAAAPDTDHLAVEVFEPGLAQLLMRIEDAALTNLRLLRGDAVDLLRERVPPDSLAAVRIFFPDPWPKRRHHKRRLVQPGFVALVASRLAPGGVLHLATDWAHYASQMRVACAGEPLPGEHLHQRGRLVGAPGRDARRPSSSAAPAAKAVTCGTSCSAEFRCAHRDSFHRWISASLRSALIHRTRVRLWVWPS